MAFNTCYCLRLQTSESKHIFDFFCLLKVALKSLIFWIRFSSNLNWCHLLTFLQNILLCDSIVTFIMFMIVKIDGQSKKIRVIFFFCLGLTLSCQPLPTQLFASPTPLQWDKRDHQNSKSEKTHGLGRGQFNRESKS